MMGRNSFIIGLFLALSSATCSLDCEARSPRVTSKISSEIEKLFSFLMIDEGFSYVLFGSKPMSVVACNRNEILKYQALYPDLPLLKLEDQWSLWEKHFSIKPKSRFALFSRTFGEWFEIYLIDKSRCLQIVSENLLLFHEKLGVALPANKIVERLIEVDEVFAKGLNSSHALFGLLLGYGLENAQKFEESFVTSPHTSLPPTKGSLEVYSNTDQHALVLPCFSSFSDRETKDLMETYQKDREKILHIYAHEDLIDLSIKKLVTETESDLG